MAQVDIRFFVEPVEPVTFGPPQSFTAGDAHRSRSQFPPSPITFQGLVRSQLLRGAKPSLDLDDWSDRARRERADLVGRPEALPTGWQLQGPHPARWVADPDGEGEPVLQPWVMAPPFLLHYRTCPVHAREIVSTHQAMNDLGTERPLFGRLDLGAMISLGGWIGPDNLWFALAGEGAAPWTAAQWCPESPPFVHSEHQPGLAIDGRTGSARHGMLYFLSALRFDRDSGLLGGLSGILPNPLRRDSLTQGSGSAGRKGRLVTFRGAGRLHPVWRRILEGRHLPDEVEDGARFWLLSLTPVRVGDPPNPHLMAKVPSGVEVEFVTALTGRPIAIGGYEIATGRPRPNRLYAPGGSTWLIKISGGTPEERGKALRQLHDQHPLGPPQEAAFGFGYTLVGLGPATTEEGP